MTPEPVLPEDAWDADLHRRMARIEADQTVLAVVTPDGCNTDRLVAVARYLVDEHVKVMRGAFISPPPNFFEQVRIVIVTAFVERAASVLLNLGASVGPRWRQ